MLASRALWLLLAALFVCCGPVGQGPQAPSPAAPPRGLILVIGDGMGPGQLALLLRARPEGALATLFAQGSIGLVDPTPFDALVTDSAAGATALATGVQTRPRMLSTDPEGRPIETLIEAGRRLGRLTAVVTTSDLTDATPAAFLSHSVSRADAKKIAAQISARPPTIALGGGANWFPSPPLGLQSFAPLDLPFRLRETRPPLAELTRQALARLDAAGGSYVLVIEGALIDKACHHHKAPELLAELIDLDEALLELLPRAASGEALLVVTADHETGGFGFTYRSAASQPGPASQPRAVSKTLPSGEVWSPGADFAASEDIDTLLRGETPPSVTWSTYTHTSALLSLAALGPGHEAFAGSFAQWQIGVLLRRAIGAGAPRAL